MTINEWLNRASNELADAMVPSARLDVEIILAHTLGRPRTWLHAHGDEKLDPRRRDIAEARAGLRLERVPIAYIIGHKEFYGRQFVVSPAVLIPRPESEVMIDLLKAWAADHPNIMQAVDVGTGSGCLGITASLELPALHMTLTDISKDALKIAKKNIELHTARRVRTLESDLLARYPFKADIILANLPYVDRSWQTSPDAIHEPAEALYAKSGGLALIYRLLDQAPASLQSGGAIFLEADPRQHEAIVAHAQKCGFTPAAQNGFIIVFE